MLARCGVLGRVSAHDAERLVGCGRLRGAQAKDAVRAWERVCAAASHDAYALAGFWGDGGRVSAAYA